MTKQELTEMVTKAKLWAIEAHAGQKDKAGRTTLRHMSLWSPRALKETR